MYSKLVKVFNFFNDYSNLVLRKTKSFNKSRYSRNRQYYRTGVYWCLWLNIILVFGLYYAFYRYTFKFSYIFIFYFVAVILGLLSYFSKNYFLGFINAVKYLAEATLFDIYIFTSKLGTYLNLILKRSWVLILCIKNFIDYLCVKLVLQLKK